MGVNIHTLPNIITKTIDKMRADYLLKDGTDLTKEGAVIEILKKWYDLQTAKIVNNG